MHLKNCALAACAAAMLLHCSSPASAQYLRHAADVSIGYQVVHIPGETFPFGLNFDASGQIVPRLQAVGEFGWARDSLNGPGESGTLNFVNLGGGVRWLVPRTAAPGSRSVAPYVQLLIGAVHAGANLTANGGSVNGGSWAFMFQPGAGVAVPLAPIVSAIGQIDYRRAFFQGGENEVRFVAGIRFGPR